MKPQGDARHPEPRGREPAAAKVADHHPPPRNAIQLADEPQAIALLEVMEELRAQDDVHAAVGKGERERIAADGGTEALPGGRDECRDAVQAEGVKLHAVPAGHLARTGRDVGESSADVEHGDVFLAANHCGLDRGAKREQRCSRSAEE